MHLNVRINIILLLSAALYFGCSSLKMGEFLPTDGKIQWIAADGKTNLMLFGDYERISDKKKWGISHPCRKTGRETTLLMAQKNNDPFIGLHIRKSRLNMLVFAAGTVLLKDTLFTSTTGLRFRQQVLHMPGKQGQITEVRYFWDNEPESMQFHFWAKKEQQEALMKEAENIMNTFSTR